MLTCTCPASTSLTAVGKFTCAEAFGQVQRVGFMRLNGAGLSTAEVSSVVLPLSVFSTAMSAATNDKLVMSPFINSPATEAGAARTFGGGNDSLDGIEEIIGAEPTTFTSVIRNAPAATIRDMKLLMCEAKAGNLGVYLFNGNNQIMGIDDSANDKLRPIPVRALFVGDKNLGGLEEPDSNALNWSFVPDWSDNVATYKLPFNPNTDLA